MSCAGSEKELLLSIIIPVYNVEPYVERCLCSVLACDLSGCEILISLGESTDKSEEVCRDYTERYPLIRTLEQDGRGLSNARNCAMRVARGDYLLFLDSDDYVDGQCLDSIISQLRSGSISADVIVTDFYREDLRLKRRVPCFQIGVNTVRHEGMDYLPQMLHKRQCFWNVWRYIYRRGFLEENGITFLENRLSEDVDFTTSVFLAQPDILFSHSPYYIYVVGRGQSLMDKPTLKRLTDTVYTLERSIARLRGADFPYAAEMAAQFQFEYILNLALCVEIDRAGQREALGLYRNWRQTLSDSGDPAVRWAKRGIGLTGLRAAAFGLHILKLLRRKVRRYRKKVGVSI